MTPDLTLNLNPEVAITSTQSPTNNLLKISNPNITAWNPKDNYVNKKNNNDFLMITIENLLVHRDLITLQWKGDIVKAVKLITGA